MTLPCSVFFTLKSHEDFTDNFTKTKLKFEENEQVPDLINWKVSSVNCAQVILTLFLADLIQVLG